MNKREQLIRQGLNKWAKASFRGTLCYATGVGKSYAGILAVEKAVERHPREPILIVGPTEVGLENFKKEFIKFKRRRLLKYCRFICYASLPNIDNESFSLVIFDELHHVTTDLKMEFFQKEIQYRALLGLSATLTEEERIKLSLYCPIVDILSLKDVEEEDFIAKYTVINFPISLTPAERKEYDKLTATIEYVQRDLGGRPWRAINKRKDIIYKAANKFNKIKKIVDLFPDEYGVIFSLGKVQADLIEKNLGEICVAIHSGHTKKNKTSRYQRFCDGRTKVRIVSAVKVFDEAVTLPRVSFGILGSRYSKSRQSIQTLGRLLRKDNPGKHAIAIRLYAKDTMEEKWVTESQTKIDNIFNVNSYENLKKIIKKIREDT